MTDLENDIGTAFMRLRAAFAKHNVPCPDFLHYEDTEKAYQALQALRRGLGPVSWAMRPDGSPLGEVQIAGFTLQFAARSVERPGTGEELDDGISGRVFFEDRHNGRGG